MDAIEDDEKQMNTQKPPLFIFLSGCQRLFIIRGAMVAFLPSSRGILGVQKRSRDKLA